MNYTVNDAMVVALDKAIEFVDSHKEEVEGDLEARAKLVVRIALIFEKHFLGIPIIDKKEMKWAEDCCI